MEGRSARAEARAERRRRTTRAPAPRGPGARPPLAARARAARRPDGLAAGSTVRCLSRAPPPPSPTDQAPWCRCASGRAARPARAPSGVSVRRGVDERAQGRALRVSGGPVSRALVVRSVISIGSIAIHAENAVLAGPRWFSEARPEKEGERTGGWRAQLRSERAGALNDLGVRVVVGPHQGGRQAAQTARTTARRAGCAGTEASERSARGLEPPSEWSGGGRPGRVSIVGNEILAVVVSNSDLG